MFFVVKKCRVYAACGVSQTPNSNVEKEVTEVMGGKVLNYRSKEIYLEGCAFGREEGQKESIVQLVTRKYQLGDSPEKIAKDLLMSEEEVEEILGKTTGSQQ